MVNLSTATMVQYLELLQDILDNGIVEKHERTGTGTKKVFGRMLRFDLGKGFPLITTKKMYTKGVIHELLWFIKGDTNIRYLVENGVHIWDEWPFQNYLTGIGLANKIKIYTPKWHEEKERFINKIINNKKFAAKYGELGPVYGKQWRDFNGFDQLGWVIKEIKRNPGSRRLIVNAWNAPLIDKMALPPCHVMYQFGVRKKKLDCIMYQRSVDTFLGLPFNIASYALLTMMVAQVTNYKVGNLVMALADTHVYLNHQKQSKEQIARKPLPIPKLKLNPNKKNINNFEYVDFKLINYKHHPAIKAPISV